jgi:cytochrome c oxidase assembly protein subunit 11
VEVGSPVLAFYHAKNLFGNESAGIATYNIVPQRAAIYFNKIQCFCFEEQRLQNGEEVDMPVYFFIDPEYTKDKHLDNVKEIVLSYTFFNSKSQ